MCLICSFGLVVDTLVCKLGVWGPLRAPEAVAFLTIKYGFSHFSRYLFFKNLNLDYTFI